MRIIIADDHQLYREALSILVQRLDANADITLLSNFAELTELAQNGEKWDLILVDLSMPGQSYEQGIALLRQYHPATPIIVVSSSSSAIDTQKAISAGALGFISKSMKSDDMLNAIKLMLQDGVSIHPNHDVKPNISLQALTPRQMDVLTLLCDGESNKSIALRLDLSEHTIKLHVRAILQALHVANRTQAVVVAKPLLTNNAKLI